MKKQIVINIAANIISFFVSFGTNFFLTPFLVKSVGKEAYGFIPLANNFTSYIAIITIALNSMAARFITIKIHQNDYKVANIYYSTVFYSNVIISFFILPLFTLITIYIEKFLNIPSGMVVSVKILFATIFLSSVLGFVTSVFLVAPFCRNRVDIRSGLSIADSLIRVVLLFTFFVFLKPDIAYIGIVNFIVVIIVDSANIYIAKKLLPELKISKEKFDKAVVKILVGSGIWNSINQLSSILLTGLDLLIANIFIDASSMGVLAIAKTVPFAFQALIVAIANAYIPQLTILYANDNKEDIIREIVFSQKVIGFFIMPIAIFIVFGDAFYTLWVPGQDARQLHLLSIITLAPMLIGGSISTFNNIFTITNKLRTPSIVLLSNGVINIIVVFALLKITTLGIYAIAGVSTVLEILRVLIFVPIYAARCLELKWNMFYCEMFKSLFSFSILYLMLLTVKQFMVIDSWLSLSIVAVIEFFIGVIIYAYTSLSIYERKLLLNKISR